MLYCIKYTDTRTHARTHDITSPRAPVGANKKTDDKRSRSLTNQTCTECHKIVDGGNMEKHMKRYHSEESRTWICSRCGESFKRNDSLPRHVRNIHHLHNRELKAVDKLYDVDNMTYQCPECKKTFDNKKHAKDHIVQSQCNLQCDVCGKQFGLAQHLNRHKKIHDNTNKSS